MGGRGADDKGAQQSARPATEDIHQGEGGTVLAVLGPVRPGLQEGDAPRSLPACEGQPRAPGSDGVTFEAIEASGVDVFLQQIQDALVTYTYQPMRLRHKAIPKDGGARSAASRSPPSVTAWSREPSSCILAPIFAADFQPGSYGYRPKRSAHDAVLRVAEAIVKYKTRVIDIDLQAYFDNVRHHVLLAKVAQRVNDPDILHVLKLILKASGKQGVPQGGVLSPLLSNLYLTEVDRMLERAKEITRRGRIPTSSMPALPMIS